MSLRSAPLREVSALLIDLLKHDRHESVRGAAANVLGQLSDNKAVEALARVLFEDNDPANRSAAATALGRINDTHVAQYLEKALLIQMHH